MKNKLITNTFKKAVAIVIALLIISGAVGVGVSAYTLADAKNLTEHYTELINSFAERFTATDDEALSMIDLDVLCENVCDSGYELCYVFSGISSEEEGYTIVDGCMYKYTAGQVPYSLGYYLVNNTEAFTLEEACNKGIVTLKGDEGMLIRRFIKAPLVAEFSATDENSRQSFYTLMNYLNANNAYTEESTAYFVGTVDEFEIAVYNNSYCGKNYEETIGDFVYSVDNCQSPFGLGVYVLQKGEVISLNEAFNRGLDLNKTNELLANTSVKIAVAAETTSPATQDKTETAPTDNTQPQSTESTENESTATTTEPVKEPQKGKYEQLFVDRLKINLDESGNDLGFYEYEEIYEYYSVSSADEAEPDYVLVFADNNLDRPLINVYEAFGDYVVFNSQCRLPYSLGYFIYVPADNMIYTLNEAYNANIEGLDCVFTESGIDAQLIGDTDNNGSINIKDVTLLQKTLAKVKMETYIRNLIADFNRDGMVNIKDATAIQKYIAKQ